MTFAERVKHFREMRGITQSELAKDAQLTPGAVGDIESGRSKSTPVIDLIAEALGVSTKMLRYGIDPAAAHGSPQPPPLTPRERKLIDQYRQLAGTSRTRLHDYISALPTRRSSSGKDAVTDEQQVLRKKVARR